MSLLGTIATTILGHVNLQQEVEDLAAPAAAKLITPHVHLDKGELSTSAKRLRDAAACLEHDPPKIEAAFREFFQVFEDALD